MSQTTQFVVPSPRINAPKFLVISCLLMFGTGNSLAQSPAQAKPLFERPNPILKVDAAKAKEIAEDAYRRITVSRSSARAHELGRLQDLLIRLIQVQVSLSDRAGYTQSAIQYVEIERLIQRKGDIASEGNAGINELIRIFRRAGDERLLRIFIDAQIKYMSTAPDFDTWAKGTMNILRSDSLSDRDLASRVNSDTDNPMCNMASFLQQIGRPAAAAMLIDIAGASVVRKENCVRAGDVFADVQNGPRAFAYFNAAIESMGRVMTPEIAEKGRHGVRFSLVLALATAGRFDEAKTYARQITAESSYQLGAYNYLSMSLLQAGRFKESADTYLERPYRDESLRWRLACALENSGDQATAEAVFRQPNKSPDVRWPGCSSANPEIADSLGRRLAILGDYEKARRWAIESAASDLPSYKAYLEAKNLVDIAFIASGDIGLYDDHAQRKR